ncbi:unnamed protein product [Heligmosomoides polygyrus]|uniref:Transmembrane protein 231 n=1 Tax=Heligmosomoides polygyrus TaxID=6339 RepID=A0A3P8BQ39_HELPZ|nr:unnamed protein product [Heligmosomoides polygyrus]
MDIFAAETLSTRPPSIPNMAENRLFKQLECCKYRVGISVGEAIKKAYRVKTRILSTELYHTLRVRVSYNVVLATIVALTCCLHLLRLGLHKNKAYNHCRVHSSSAAHREQPASPSSDLITYPFEIQTYGSGITQDLFEDFVPKNRRDVSLVTLMSFFVRRAEISSLIINMRNANKFTPSFFAKGTFHVSHLSACQLNIAYPKPTNANEVVEFRNTWMRLLYDRRSFQNFVIAATSFYPALLCITSTMDNFFLPMFNPHTKKNLSV